MTGRLRAHHGIRRRNAGLYLKELEWKYNHRTLSTQERALALTHLLADDLLERCSPTRGHRDGEVRNGT